MLIIAHRGASKKCRENTIEAYNYAADRGADIIEADIRATKDNEFVLFHDDNLLRIAGIDLPLAELAVKDINMYLHERELPSVLTVKDLINKYERTVPFLFDLKFSQLPGQLINLLLQIPFDFYIGARTLDVLNSGKKVRNKDRILGFIPDKDAVNDFIKSGAGVIRLWENWMDKDLIEQCHKLGAKVWIMTNNAAGVGETDISTIEQVYKTDANGILLNDIDLILD